MTAILVLVCSAAGLCGGPPVAGRAETGPAPGPYAGQAGGADAAAASNWSVNAGGGSSSPSGTNGRSPFVSLSDIGIKSAYTQIYGVSYVPELAGNALKLSANLMTANYSHSGVYSGPLTEVLTPGLSYDAKLTVSAIQVNADVNLATSVFGRNNSIKLGPRLQYVNYSDSMKMTNNDGVGIGGTSEVSGTKAHGLFGLGFFGSICLTDLTGFSSGANSVFTPRINFAASIGAGNGMRYAEGEAFLELVTMARNAGEWGKYVPNVKAEVGVITYRFDETVDELGNGALNSILQRTGNARYDWTVPVLRFAFSY